MPEEGLHYKLETGLCLRPAMARDCEHYEEGFCQMSDIINVPCKRRITHRTCREVFYIFNARNTRFPRLIRSGYVSGLMDELGSEKCVVKFVFQMYAAKTLS